ncbi:MAG: hypothetical protein M5R36_18670 [Deltaproteobacteria bacterium]|nr:hypothetical protein [Deltaproteobacteria bacterium]
MTVPVTFAVLTTITAFMPLMFIPGIMGKIFGTMPIIVALIFITSLVESFFILPAHLAHGRGKNRAGFWGGSNGSGKSSASGSSGLSRNTIARRSNGFCVSGICRWPPPWRR